MVRLLYFPVVRFQNCSTRFFSAPCYGFKIDLVQKSVGNWKHYLAVMLCFLFLLVVVVVVVQAIQALYTLAVQCYQRDGTTAGRRGWNSQRRNDFEMTTFVSGLLCYNRALS